MSHRPVPPASARLRRSLLAVPASSMKMMQKAVGTDADAVFLDLEDAVAAPEKEAARQLAITSLQELDWRGSGKTISCASTGLILSGQWLIWLRLSVRPGRISIPLSSRNSVARKTSMLLIPLSPSWPGRRFVPPALEGLIETAAGVSNLEAIAR